MEETSRLMLTYKMSVQMIIVRDLKRIVILYKEIAKKTVRALEYCFFNFFIYY
jgi:hypothetical protein